MSVTSPPQAWAVWPTPEAHVVTDRNGNTWIAYAGGESTLKLLETSGARGYATTEEIRRWNEGVDGPYGWLLLPVERWAFLLLETVGKLEEVSPIYLTWRRSVIGRHDSFACYYPETPEGLPLPFQHQLECFSAALEAIDKGKQGFGCFMEMGLGKTRWAVDLAKGLRSRVTLILVQKIAIEQWRCCICNAFPEAECILLTGLVRGRAETIRRLAREPQEKPLVLVLNWDVLYRLADELARFGDRLDLIIADEATRLRTRTSQVSKAARRLSRVARWRIPLTGTPMATSPGDLWAIFTFLDDRIFGKSYWEMMKRYCRLGGYSGWEFAGLIPERLPELIDKLHTNSYRATKATVLDMPPKLYQTVRLDMEPEQAKIYRQLKRDYGVSVDLEHGGKGTLSVTSVIAQTTRLQQVTAGILPFTEVEGEETVEWQELPSAKTEWTVEYVTTTLEDTDAQIVIWTKFKPEIDRLARELRAAGIELDVIDGRTPDGRREEALKRYADREDPLRVLLINIQAGAYSLDLQSCDVLVYHSSSFNILDRLQSEDRGHRAGRTRSYQVIDLVLNNTVDQDIEEARKKRLNLMAMLIGQGAPSCEEVTSG